MERKKRSIKFFEFFLILGLLISLPQNLSALSITVKDVECVYEFVLYEGDLVSGNFVVVDHDIFWSSDHPGIDLVVTSPGGNTVHTVKGTSGDKFEFKAPRGGMYKFCFHNMQKTPETVSFYIHSSHIPNEHNLAKDEHLDPINVKIAELREALESVTAEQKYLKAREARHRHTTREVSFTFFTLKARKNHMVFPVQSTMTSSFVGLAMLFFSLFRNRAHSVKRTKGRPRKTWMEVA